MHSALSCDLSVGWFTHWGGLPDCGVMKRALGASSRQDQEDGRMSGGTYQGNIERCDRRKSYREKERNKWISKKEKGSVKGREQCEFGAGKLAAILIILKELKLKKSELV